VNRITIVIPARNEEENVGRTVEMFRKGVGVSAKIIVVNDHSTDRTREIALELSRRYPDVRVVDNAWDAGFARAIGFGVTRAQTELVVVAMADSSDDPETIQEMLAKMDEGYDIVCGSRYMRGGRKIEPFSLQSLFSRIVGLSFHWLTGIPTHDISNAFKMYKREVLNDFEWEKCGFEVSMVATYNAWLEACRVAEVPTTWHHRQKGSPKFKLTRALRSYLPAYLYGVSMGILHNLNIHCGGRWRK